ncbi:lymphocyte antigen 6B-like [Oculina patagonica]
METLTFVFVALLALCVMPSALALKCYECTNIPGYSAASQCSDEPLGTITCKADLNRCMTVKGTITVAGAGSLDIEIKNCTNSFVCDPASPYSMCKLLNITGMMSDCNTECCEGDLCNGAVRISGLLASFAAILLALVLNL